MKTIVRMGSTLASAVLLSALAGCAAETGETSKDSEAVSQTTQEVVASADVGYGTVYFYDVDNGDGTRTIAIGQSAPIAYGATPLNDVMAQHTNLEVFLALVPDQEAPQSYVDAHANQAKALGRETDEILEVHFDPNAAVEKVSATCRNWITPATQGCFDYTYSGIKELNNAYGTSAQNVTLSATTNRTTSGICNDGTGNVKGRLRYSLAGQGSYNSPGWTPDVGPGGGWIWFGAYVSGTCTPTPPNTICLPPNLNVNWRVEGKSNSTSTANTYDLRAAIISSSVYDESNAAGCVIR
jgi:hypothetical protein